MRCLLGSRLKTVDEGALDAVVQGFLARRPSLESRCVNIREAYAFLVLLYSGLKLYLPGSLLLRVFLPLLFLFLLSSLVLQLQDRVLDRQPRHVRDAYLAARYNFRRSRRDLRCRALVGMTAVRLASGCWGPSVRSLTTFPR